MSEIKRKIILKKLKTLNTIWHPESALVFKSQKEKIVIGRYVDDQLVHLDDKALKLCDEWRFKPDESLLDSEEDGEEDEEENKEEDEEKDKKEEEEDEGEDKNYHFISNTYSKTLESLKEYTKHLTFAVQEVEHCFEQSETKNTSLRNDLLAKTEEINNLQSENASLRNDLLAKTEEMNNLQSEYDVIKKKFDTMKSLFS